MRIAASDGVELELRDLGGAGRPVVFAHGIGFNGAVWGPVAHAVPTVRAFALDLRGHGASRVEPEHPFSWDALARDTRAAAQAVHRLTGERPAGVGHSGGAVALLLAASEYRALLLYEPPGADGAPPERVQALAAAAQRRRDWFPSHDAAEQTLALREPLKSFDPRVRRAYVEAGFGPGPAGTVKLACRPEDEARLYRMGQAPDAPVPCPVIRLEGELSEPWRRRPGSEIFPGSGHYGPLEAPEAFAARLAAFV
ncbi:MAG TPA: alpha/beta hydrolase [Solirubrobacter sp.]|nr:alpha/beta hydrolase [Solirubrobacter sp.]